MAGGREIIRERVDAGLADMASLSRAAGKNAAYIQQFLRRHIPQELPEAVREALAPVLGVLPDTLREGGRAAMITPAMVTNVRPALNVPMPLGAAMFPKNVPIQGQAQGSEDGAFEIYTGATEDWIDLAPRWPGIAHNKAVFALYIVGDSMEPWREPGELIYVDPKRPVRPMDYVVACFAASGPHEPRRAMVKRLESRRGGKVGLLQYNPRKTQMIDSHEIESLWRVLSSDEVMGVR